MKRCVRTPLCQYVLVSPLSFVPFLSFFSFLASYLRKKFSGPVIQQTNLQDKLRVLFCEALPRFLISSLDFFRRQAETILAVVPQVVGPDLFPRAWAHFWIIELDVDPIQDCGVKVIHAIRGEYENSFEILESAQEHSDDGMAGEIFCVTLLQEDIGFVEQ